MQCLIASSYAHIDIANSCKKKVKSAVSWLLALNSSPLEVVLSYYLLFCSVVIVIIVGDDDMLILIDDKWWRCWMMQIYVEQLLNVFVNCVIFN